FVVLGYMSMSLPLTGSGRRLGDDHPLLKRVTYQVSTPLVVSAADGPLGRPDEKYSRAPSGENEGSRSRYTPENGRTVGVLHRPSTRTDIISAMGRGGANFVNTTVRPSGVNVEAKTSPVDTTPGANTTAESVRLSGVTTRARGELAHATNGSDATTRRAARAREMRDVRGMSVRYRRVVS